MKRPEELRDVDTVLDAFHAVVKQRDAAKRHTIGHTMLTQRAMALAWVLKHPEIEEVMIDEEAMLIFECCS